MSGTMSLIDNSTFVAVKPNDRETPDDGLSESSAPIDKSPFRKIEFHLARKPFTACTNGGGGDSFHLETLNPTTSSNNTHNDQNRVAFDCVSGGSSGKKRDASELDPELSFGINLRRIGAGLENLGNTCFLNSVLQCLTYTEPLAAYLQSGKHQITCRNAGFCVLCAIQKHVSRALQSSGRSLAPKDLVSNLRCISRTFRNSRQEDAHEYMVNLLESMHKCCLPSGVPSESPIAYERSLVHKIFGGRLRSQVKCMQCNYCSNNFDPFLDLSLEILKADTLYKAFADFTAKEQLDGGAKQYQCQQCKQKVKALKQLTIHKAPNVLTIHLKRFGSHMSGQKINKNVHFAPTLDLKPFVTGPCDGDLKYTLYGVLVHAGWSIHSGHYYCFVRTSSGMWYSLDDNQVIQVSERKVFEQKAYMLFYFRDRKNFPSKKPADVVHKKEMVMNSVGRNNTRPIISEEKTGDTNGTPKSSAQNVDVNGSPESSAQEVISESCLESSLMVLQQNDMVNVPSFLHEAGKSNLSVEKRHDIYDAMKVDSASVGDLATTSTSDGPQKFSPMNGKKEAFSTMFQECEDKRSTHQDLSDSTAVTICSKPRTAPGDSVCVAQEEDAPRESHGASVSGGGDDGRKGAITSVESSSLPKMASFSIEDKVLDRKTHKKIKKNPLRIKVTSMKFCSNILMGALLNLRKKKKLKRKKRSKLPIENLHVKGVQSGSKIKDKTSVNCVEKEFKERVYGDGAVLGTSVKRNSNAVSGRSWSEVRRPESSNNCMTPSTQNERVRMLTAGFEDRTIPRWGEDESTPSQRRETWDAPSIGYVGDGWDEEYDRGKRKKPRSLRTEFDGRNPFQDTANERLNLHAAKRKKLSKKHSTQFKKSSRQFWGRGSSYTFVP